MVATASFISPASGLMAPRRPSMPARHRSSSSQGAKSRWCFAADPKSQRNGLASRVSNA